MVATGWDLWSRIDAHRDDFLCGPAPGLNDARLTEPAYPDAVAMGKALLHRLKDDANRQLVVHEAVLNFWSQHSDRASLPSMAACLSEVLTEWVDELGRWPQAMSSAYVRTHFRQVRSVQQKVGAEARMLAAKCRLDEEEMAWVSR